jgi:hypothetical protein
MTCLLQSLQQIYMETCTLQPQISSNCRHGCQPGVTGFRWTTPRAACATGDGHLENPVCLVFERLPVFVGQAAHHVCSHKLESLLWALTALSTRGIQCINLQEESSRLWMLYCLMRAGSAARMRVVCTREEPGPLPPHQQRLHPKPYSCCKKRRKTSDTRHAGSSRAGLSLTAGSGAGILVAGTTRGVLRRLPVCQHCWRLQRQSPTGVAHLAAASSDYASTAGSPTCHTE